MAKKPTKAAAAATEPAAATPPDRPLMVDLNPHAKPPVPRKTY